MELQLGSKACRFSRVPNRELMVAPHLLIKRGTWFQEAAHQFK
jgi:hypothetical protein